MSSNLDSVIDLLFQLNISYIGPHLLKMKFKLTHEEKC